MRVERIEILPFSIPFRRLFRAAGIGVSERTGLIIRLTGEAGMVGLGEVATHPLISGRPLDRSFVHAMRESLECTDLTALLEANVPPAARPGLESACLDLRARAAGIRVADLLGGAQRQRVSVNGTLDQHDAREAGETARRLVEQGFNCIKIKASPADLPNDDARLGAIRAAAGGKVKLRLDANASWSVEQSVETISRLEAHGLDYVEQPVARIEDLARVRRQVQTPIAADESVTDVAAVEAIAAVGAADLVVIKPALLGLPASGEVVSRALALGLGVVVTSTLDTSVGIAAALHLAATLPKPVLPCGLATLDFLVGDLVSEPLVVRDGHMELPEAPGLGVHLEPESLKRWARVL